MRSRACAICASSASTFFLWPPISSSSASRRTPEILRLLLVLRDALLDGAAFLHLRFQASARALGLHLPLGELLARFGELVLDLVAGHLLALVRLFALRHLLAEGLQFAGGQVQIDRRLGGIALQQAVLAAEHHAQAGFQLDLELAVALGLGRLPLERIHLAGDFLQNVVDARQILLGAFQLGFGQALAVLNLVMPAASSITARRSCGLELRIWPMRPCSMMA